MYVAAIIAAGGRGVRLGADRPKQFLEIQGSSILELSIKALAASDRIDEIVVALPEDHLDAVARSFQGQIKQPLHFVAGGERRQDSVANAFAKTSEQADVIVIHDAARPFVTTDVIDRAIDGALEYGAAIAAVTVRDTVKQTGDANAQGSRRILATIPRDSVFLAQTPQAFGRDVLARALAEGTQVDATDEAMLVERLGLPVHIVEGDPRNVKITTPEDLRRSGRSQSRGSSDDGVSRRLRIGNGYDLHRLVAGRPLILGGVTIPFELGLDGHSDADIVCHAVTDAVLGAAGIGDIGRLFPGYRSEVEGRGQHRAIERRDREGARGRLSRVEYRCDGDCAEAEAASVSRRDAGESRRGARRRAECRQRQRQDERRRGKHGPQ